MKILLVEDEKDLSDAVCQILRSSRYEAVPAYDGETGLDEALSGIYDLLLLDIMLPVRDGISILREYRASGGSAPVLLLTAKGAIQDKVRGLDSGADDYLSKPFAAEELLARVRALSRRKGEFLQDDRLSFGDLQLDLSAYELRRGANHIRLSNKEFEILRYFFLHEGQVARKEDLLVKLWGYDSPADSNNLEVYLSFLRKKLGFLHSGVRITSVRGIGYRLEEGNA